MFSDFHFLWFHVCVTLSSGLRRAWPIHLRHLWRILLLRWYLTCMFQQQIVVDAFSQLVIHLLGKAAENGLNPLSSDENIIAWKLWLKKTIAAKREKHLDGPAHDNDGRIFRCFVGAEVLSKEMSENHGISDICSCSRKNDLNNGYLMIFWNLKKKHQWVDDAFDHLKRNANAFFA